MPNPPFWPWCPQAGVQRTVTLAVDQVAYGDGYIHRATRGLNPARAKWQMQVPFKTTAELQERFAFLKQYAANGFWMQPPDDIVEVFVTADEWSATIVDRTGAGEMAGTLSLTVTQSFNPQPVVVP